MLVRKLMLTVLIGSAACAAPACANTILTGPTAAMATDRSLSLNFNSSAETAAISFIIDGYRSLDGKNAYEDDFSLSVNNRQVFLGTFNLGGGSNSGSQANVYFNPYGASFANLTDNGTGIGWTGGKELISFAGLPVDLGSNTLTFAYTSLAGAGYAGFQGLGDEGWGIQQVQVSATPLPPSWTMLLLGLCGFGYAAHRWQRKGNDLVAA